MSECVVRNPHFEALVRHSFGRQGLMATLGSELVRVDPGEVVIEVPYTAGLTQQHGYFHAGTTTTILDTACGYAALTLMPPGSDVLSVEFKVNLLAPARGDRLAARARVVRSGRTITVCQADAYGVAHDGEVHCATMTATMIRVATDQVQVPVSR